MINDGLGLCVELMQGTRDRALWAVCDRDGDDVKVSAENPTPYVVATKDGEHSWCWGHYFITLADAVKYLMEED